MATRSRKTMRASRPDFYPMDPLYQLSESVAVLETATETNQRQISEIASNTNKAINDLATNTAQQFKDISVVLEKHGTATNSRLEALAENFQASQKPNIIAWFAGAGVLFTMIAAAMWIISLNTENTVFKNLIPIQAALDANSARDAVSERDRSKLNEAQEANRGQIEALKADNQVLHSNLAEVETQLDATAQGASVQFAEQQRMNNIMVQIGQGAGTPGHPPIVYPSAPVYFPNISARSNGGNHK